MTKTELQKLWETRLAEFKASGKSVKEWCAVHDHVTPRQVWYWLSKFKTQNGDSSANSVRWLPLEVREELPLGHGNSLLIKIGQASIEVRPGFDQALFSQVVRVLLPLC